MAITKLQYIASFMISMTSFLKQDMFLINHEADDQLYHQCVHTKPVKVNLEGCTGFQNLKKIVSKDALENDTA